VDSGKNDILVLKTGEQEKKKVLNRLGRFNKKHHSFQTPSHEKEIRFKICLL